MSNKTKKILLYTGLGLLLAGLVCFGIVELNGNVEEEQVAVEQVEVVEAQADTTMVEQQADTVVLDTTVVEEQAQ